MILLGKVDCEQGECWSWEPENWEVPDTEDHSRRAREGSRAVENLGIEGSKAEACLVAGKRWLALEVGHPRLGMHQRTHFLWVLAGSLRGRLLPFGMYDRQRTW